MLSKLPVEIIDLIIRECVSPWGLQVKMRYRRTGGLAEVQVRGLPREAKWKLINNVFYDAVTTALRASFNGRLDARSGDDRPPFSIYEKLSRLPQWLWNRVVIFQLRENTLSTCEEWLSGVAMPSLQLVYIQVSSWFVPTDVAAATVGRFYTSDEMKSPLDFWSSKISMRGRIVAPWLSNYLVTMESKSRPIVMYRRRQDYPQKPLQLIGWLECRYWEENARALGKRYEDSILEQFQ